MTQRVSSLYTGRRGVAGRLMGGSHGEPIDHEVADRAPELLAQLAQAQQPWEHTAIPPAQ